MCCNRGRKNPGELPFESPDFRFEELSTWSAGLRVGDRLWDRREGDRQFELGRRMAPEIRSDRIIGCNLLDFMAVSEKKESESLRSVTDTSVFFRILVIAIVLLQSLYSKATLRGLSLVGNLSRQ